jgi:hypothetical protein
MHQQNNHTLNNNQARYGNKSENGNRPVSHSERESSLPVVNDLKNPSNTYIYPTATPAPSSSSGPQSNRPRAKSATAGRRPGPPQTATWDPQNTGSSSNLNMNNSNNVDKSKKKSAIGAYYNDSLLSGGVHISGGRSSSALRRTSVVDRLININKFKK